MEDGMARSPHARAALSFLRLVIGGKISEAYATHVDPRMRHHNPFYAGDASSLQKGMEENDRAFPSKSITIKNVIEDGNLVAVHSNVRLEPGKPGFATVHMFRFEGDKVVEMWDIVQEVPKDSPNKNGMF